MTWTIRVVNWEKFQHYDKRRTKQTRAMIWFKMYCALLDKREWRELRPTASKLLIDIWLLAPHFVQGEITLPLADIAWRLRLEIVEMLADLELLTSLSFIEIASEALEACQQVASVEERRGEERRTEERRKNLSAPPIAKQPGSWVAPFCEAWQERFQGIAPGGRIGRALKPLRPKFADDEILTRWKRYLAQAEASYASPEKFAQTYGAWDGTAKTSRPDGTEFLPGEDIDQYITRHGGNA